MARNGQLKNYIVHQMEIDATKKNGGRVIERAGEVEGGLEAETDQERPYRKSGM